MWNPRLISEDVGVGFNVRKLRRYFLRYTIHSLHFKQACSLIFNSLNWLQAQYMNKTFPSALVN